MHYQIIKIIKNFKYITLLPNDVIVSLVLILNLKKLLYQKRWRRFWLCRPMYLY